MTSEGQRDGLAIALLVTGVVLAVVAAFLPVIQVNGRSGQVALAAWSILPWFTKLKFAALGLLLAAAFLPALHRWRLPIAVLALLMVFVPALASFISATWAWGTLRADLARLSGERQPIVHPGLANALLAAAAGLVAMAVARLEGGRDPSGAEPARA